MTNKLVHVAQIEIPKKGKTYIFLRESAPHEFSWFIEKDSEPEEKSSIGAENIEEALRIAHRHWRLNSFRTVICGFRYSLPERDEHGMNALFHQMAASYGSMNGIYFDSEVGYNCFVQNASDEALDLWRKLSKEKRL